MGWVKDAIASIEKGENAKVRPHGGSMRGRIESGQLVTIEPASFSSVQEDDVVFIKWKNNYILHIVKEKSEEQVLICNNLGKVNGWAPGHNIIGKVTKVED